MALNKVPGPLAGRPQISGMKSAKLLWRLARWGRGMRGMRGEQAGLKDATCWTLEACCGASVAEPACLVCFWQALPPARVPSPPSATRLWLAGFFSQSSLRNLFSAVSALARRWRNCDSLPMRLWQGKKDWCPTFANWWRKKKMSSSF